MNLIPSIKHILRPVFLATILSVTSFAAQAQTNLNYLAPGKPDAATVLTPPPLLGSAEQIADMETVHVVFHFASSNDMAAAYGEKKFSVFNFTAAVGPFFIATNLPLTTAFFEKVQLDAEIVTDLGKDYFKRPRPYTTDPSLANGKLEKSFGYPSGHSTESMTLALVLAEMLPEKHEAIMDHARLMGWHRVQIARHYPTDIYAGRVLAQAIVKQLKKSDWFEKDFAQAKAEVEAVRSAAKN